MYAFMAIQIHNAAEFAALADGQLHGHDRAAEGVTDIAQDACWKPALSRSILLMKTARGKLRSSR